MQRGGAHARLRHCRDRTAARVPSGGAFAQPKCPRGSRTVVHLQAGTTVHGAPRPRPVSSAQLFGERGGYAGRRIRGSTGSRNTTEKGELREEAWVSIPDGPALSTRNPLGACVDGRRGVQITRNRGARAREVLVGGGAEGPMIARTTRAVAPRAPKVSNMSVARTRRYRRRTLPPGINKAAPSTAARNIHHLRKNTRLGDRILRIRALENEKQGGRAGARGRAERRPRTRRRDLGGGARNRSQFWFALSFRYVYPLRALSGRSSEIAILPVFILQCMRGDGAELFSYRSHRLETAIYTARFAILRAAKNCCIPPLRIIS